MKLGTTKHWTLSPCLLLVVVPLQLLCQGVEGQQNPRCDVAQAAAASWLDLQDQCDDSPSCECDYTDSGYFYGECVDQNTQCSSSMDSSVCGTQAAAVVYGFDETTLELLTSDVYVWQYTSGRTEKLTWTYLPDGTCTFSIEQTSGAETSCTCQWTNCNGATADSKSLYIDCSNYESRAVADECLNGLGVSTGSVLEGLAVTFAGQCAASTDSSGSAPTPTFNYNAPTPTTTSTPHPAPTPTYTSRSSATSNDGTLVGVVIGVLVAGLVVAGLVGLYVWYRRRKHVSEANAAVANGKFVHEAHVVLETSEAVPHCWRPTDETTRPSATDPHDAAATGNDVDDKAGVGSNEDKRTTHPSAPAMPEIAVVYAAVAQPAHTREYADETGVRVIDEVYCR